MLEMRVNRNFAKGKAFRSFRPLTRKILEIIEEGQEEGVIRKDVNKYMIRHLILGMLEHLVTRWLLREEKYDLLAQYQEAGELIVRGICNPDILRSDVR